MAAATAAPRLKFVDIEESIKLEIVGRLLQKRYGETTRKLATEYGFSATMIHRILVIHKNNAQFRSEASKAAETFYHTSGAVATEDHNVHQGDLTHKTADSREVSDDNRRPLAASLHLSAAKRQKILNSATTQLTRQGKSPVMVKPDDNDDSPMNSMNEEASTDEAAHIGDCILPGLPGLPGPGPGEPEHDIKREIEPFIDEERQLSEGVKQNLHGIQPAGHPHFHVALQSAQSNRRKWREQAIALFSGEGALAHAQAPRCASYTSDGCKSRTREFRSESHGPPDRAAHRPRGRPTLRGFPEHNRAESRWVPSRSPVAPRPRAPQPGPE